MISVRPIVVLIGSFVITSVVIGYAYYQKKQFYPTVVHITKSNPGLAVLYIQSFILMLMVGNILKKIFFGELRQIEVEHLMERSWYTVTETCLAFTVFRDDFTPKFVALFILLFFVKSFHWLAEERVDFMERSPVISLLFHVRIISLLGALLALDANFISYAYHSTITKGPSVQLIFGFEYAVLLTVLLNVLVKYILHCLDLRRQVPWEHKAVFLLYTELVISFIKATLITLFALIMFRMYTVPIFVFRSMYYTVREFKKAFNDVIMSRRAIRNMNTLYPDATPEELTAEDNLCIICREEMSVGVASKKLPCNHIFHTTCLRSWFQRQQTCPTCRLNILGAPPVANNQRNQQPQDRRPDQNPTNAPPNNQSTTSNQSASASMPSAPNSTLPQANQPFFPPFPPMMFGMPPPLPPFQNLSDEELRKLESQKREGLLARINHLQNIQTLLDTSVVMLQQYCSVVAMTQGAPTPFANEASTSSSSQSDPSNNADQGDTSTLNIPSTSKGQQKSAQDASVLPDASNTPSTSTADEQSMSHEQKIIRQRRLEMFDK